MKVDEERLEKLAFILKSIAHPMRLGIVDLLTHYEQLSVNEISEKLGLEQSLTSHHLNNLKLKGILTSYREGKNIYYRLKMSEVSDAINCMEQCNLIKEVI